MIDDERYEELLREVAELREQLVALEVRVTHLESPRPGRRPAAELLAPHQSGVCAVAPTVPSDVCPIASMHLYQKGCRGQACRAEVAWRGSPAYARMRAKQTSKKAR
jgi:hypothetical protein